jgi:glycosyltransferase involved in cell wall biosynthesis
VRIAHITLHGCIRAQKVGWTQITQGHTVYFVAQQVAAAHSANAYNGVLIFDPTPQPGQILPDETQLTNSIKLLEPHVDIFHVHNEPNWIFKTVRQATRKPVIFDIHDWTSLRGVEDPVPFELEGERFALEYADGFCVPSKGYLKKIRSLTKKPTGLVYSMVPGFLFPQPQGIKNPGLVFEGGVKGKGDLRYNYAYRNWAQFAQDTVKMLKEEVDFFFYTANGGEDFEEYKHDRIKISPPLVYDDLLRMLSTHSLGLVGSPFPVSEFNDAMPNKLFEYVAAGIPCMVFNSPEAKDYVERQGIGCGIQDVSQVPMTLEKLKDHKMLQDRWAYTMESQMPSLNALYQEVLWSRGRRGIIQG